MGPTVTDPGTRVPLAVRRLLVVVALVATATLGWRETHAVFSDTTTNTGNSITVVNCTAQILGNPGFETGTPAPWAATYADEITNSGPPPRTGSFNAVLDLDNNTDKRKSLTQTVSIPSFCATATFSFWLRIQTSPAPGVSNMHIRVLNSTGATVLATLQTFPHTTTATYQQYTYNLTAYRGQTIMVRFEAIGTGTRRTIYIIDDTSLTLTAS
ncbi:choice-of-anchor J domain-containing protein [Actinophytocola sp.]|uniref:choice-of-anchor J domain-containing protein n=1 Tax=Actinophytocola sp. TaxID=1872138 RepID=UPI002ED28491